MKVVLDTNVLIAAFIARGVCADLLEHCVLNHEVVLSEHILDELQRHLLGKFKYTADEASQVLGLLRSHVTLVTPVPLEQPVCRDPDDDLVLATAVAGNAACLVTGDKDLLVLQSYKNLEILAPSQFAEFESRPGESQAP
jgi:uncharacterized protein